MGLGFYGALRNGGKVGGPIIIGALLQVFSSKLVFPGLGVAALLVAATLLAVAASRRGSVQPS